LLLLVDAALVARALGTALDVYPGFDTHDMRIASTNLQMRNYRPDAARRLLDQWRASLLAQPGVRGVAFTSRPPLSLGNSTNVIKTSDDRRDWVSADIATVSNEYFIVLGVPLVAGRAFSTIDIDGSERVAVVSAELARRYYKSPAQAIGRPLKLAGDDR